MDPRFDGVVIGAGAAGMVAALRAAGLGGRIALLDGDGGSNLAASSGLFSAAGTRFQRANGVEDSPALWAQDVLGKTAGAVDPVILGAVTRRAADVAVFFADVLGFAVRNEPGLEIPGHSARRLHSAHSEGGGGLAGLLRAAVDGNSGITVLDRMGDGLLVEDGVVVGVETVGGPVLGRATLLASGGYGGNRALLARFAAEIVGAVYIGCGPNDGRAHRWGEALGGTLTLMDSYQGQGHTLPDGSGRLGPGLTSFGAIVVDAEGRRFADESMGPSEFGAFVLGRPGGVAVEVFDGRIHEAAMQLSTYRAVFERGLVIEAADLAALAGAFGLPLGALCATMAEYAESVAGRPDPFGRRVALHPLVPPYRAARVTGALAHTQGGLLVDGAARVRRGGGVVPGLLAAGGAAAGISGHGAAGYLPGNGLGHAFALGLIAGETMACALQSRSLLPYLKDPLP